MTKHYQPHKLASFLCRWVFQRRRKGRKVTLNFIVGPPLLKSKPQPTKDTMDIQLTNEQKVQATLTPVTATGKPAKIDGKPVWSVPTGTATVAPADDGMSAYIVSGDEPGPSVIVVSADADLGEGVETIEAHIDLTVVGAKAASLGLTLGTPEAK